MTPPSQSGIRPRINGGLASRAWRARHVLPGVLAMMNLLAWQEEVTGPLRYERALPIPVWSAFSMTG